MEVYTTKGVIIMYPLALFAIMLMILLDGYCCGAAVIVKTNTTFRCDGRLDECLIEDDLELEFLMNPYVSRVLADPPPKSYGNQAGKKGQPAFPACNPGYCVPKPKSGSHNGCERKGGYAKPC